MTIPPETRRLYQECREIYGHVGVQPWRDEQHLGALCDALQWAVAQALELEFNHNFSPPLPPTRGWTAEGWLAKARERLMEKNDENKKTDS